MKSQLMLDRESAMATRQKFTIQSNELTRRLYNIDEEIDEVDDEVERVIEDFTRQTKNSGWEIREAREMVVSGYLGWQRRMEKRKKEGGMKYRSAGSSLQSRTRRKLLGKEEWYKESGEKRK